MSSAMLTNGMNKSTSRSPDLDRFLLALDTWAENGRVASVTCDQCNHIIRFRQEGTATWHECDCGKFSGVLRGL